MREKHIGLCGVIIAWFLMIVTAAGQAFWTPSFPNGQGGFWDDVGNWVGSSLPGENGVLEEVTVAFGDPLLQEATVVYRNNYSPNVLYERLTLQGLSTWVNFELNDDMYIKFLDLETRARFQHLGGHLEVLEFNLNGNGNSDFAPVYRLRNGASMGGLVNNPVGYNGPAFIGTIRGGARLSIEGGTLQTDPGWSLTLEGDASGIAKFDLSAGLADISILSVAGTKESELNVSGGILRVRGNFAEDFNLGYRPPQSPPPLEFGAEARMNITGDGEVTVRGLQSEQVDMYVGRDFPGKLVQNGAASKLHVEGTLRVGHNSTGLFRLLNGFYTGSRIVIGGNSGGTLEQLGGSLELGPSTDGVWPGHLVVGKEVMGEALYTLGGGTLATHTTSVGGFDKRGSMTQAVGTSHTTTTLFVGSQGPDGEGTYVMNGGTLTTGITSIFDSVFDQLGGTHTNSEEIRLNGDDAIFNFTGGNVSSPLLSLTHAGEFRYTGGTLNLGSMFMLNGTFRHSSGLTNAVTGNIEIFEGLYRNDGGTHDVGGDLKINGADSDYDLLGGNLDALSLTIESFGQLKQSAGALETDSLTIDSRGELLLSGGSAVVNGVGEQMTLDNGTFKLSGGSLDAQILELLNVASFEYTGGTVTLGGLDLRSDSTFQHGDGLTNTVAGDVRLFGGVYTQSGGTHTISGELRVVGNGSSYDFLSGGLGAEALSIESFGQLKQSAGSLALNSLDVLAGGDLLVSGGSMMVDGAGKKIIIDNGAFNMSGGSVSGRFLQLINGGEFNFTGGTLSLGEVDLISGTFRHGVGLTNTVTGDVRLLDGLYEQDGGAHDVNGDLEIAGSGTLYDFRGGNLDANSLTINTGGQLKQTAGALGLNSLSLGSGGSLLMNGGSAVVAGATVLAGPLTIEAGASFSTATLDLGGVSSRLVWNGGMLDISNDGLTSGTGTIFGDTGVLSGSRQLSVSGDVVIQDGDSLTVEVGTVLSSGSGLRVEEGGAFTQTGGAVQVESADVRQEITKIFNLSGGNFHSLGDFVFSRDSSEDFATEMQGTARLIVDRNFVVESSSFEIAEWWQSGSSLLTVRGQLIVANKFTTNEDGFFLRGSSVVNSASVLVGNLGAGKFSQSTGTQHNVVGSVELGGASPLGRGTYQLSGGQLVCSALKVGAGFRSSGSVRHAGGNILISGALEIGSGAQTDGDYRLFVGAGNLEAGSLSIALGADSEGKFEQNAGNVVVAGSATNGDEFIKNGGTFSASHFANNGTMKVVGGGFVANVTNNGLLEPGQSPGLWSLDGGLTNSGNGTLRFEIDGRPSESEQWDKIEATGAVVLDGVIEIVFNPFETFAPEDGDEWEIIRSATAVTGQFSVETISGAALPEGGVLEVVVEESKVLLVYRQGPASKTLSEWVTEHGLSGSDALAFADPDHDSRVNLIEFVTGGNPNSNEDVVNPVVQVENGHVTVTLAKPDYIPLGVTVLIQFSNDLIVWNDGDAVVITDDAHALKVQAGAPWSADSPTFVRLKILVP